ncbi:hypothetical protein ACE6H2_009875 [Prunus campanulata]
MAVIRLDGDDDGDKIQATLNSALLDKDMSTKTNDLLASNTWEEVPSSKTLIIPLKCKELWEEFKENTKDIVSKAIAEQYKYLYHVQIYSSMDAEILCIWVWVSSLLLFYSSCPYGAGLPVSGEIRKGSE